MTQQSFEVVFSGQLVEGAAEEQVKANVAALFKVEVAKVERLFSGAAVSIKKGVDEATAKKYQMALHKAGAICRVVNRAAAPAQAAPSQGQAATTPTPKDEAVVLQKSVVKAPPQGLGEFEGAAIDAPGTILVEHQEPERPQIDTSGLSMDQPGVTLTEHQEVVPPQLDTSGLSMGEEGEALGELEPFEALEVDTSDMSMDEAGVILVEHEEVEKPDIDTSELSLE